MIAAAMLYAIAISALITAGALIAERACIDNAWPRRGIWLIAMAASLMLPLLLMSTISDRLSGLQALAPASPQFKRTVSDARPQDTARTARVVSLAERVTTVLKFQWPSFPQFDSALKYSWAAASFGVAFLSVIGWVRLRRTMRGWPAQDVHNATVRVSDRVGPAVVGFANPEVVLPRWLVAMASPVCEMAIAHEREHIQARDPLCLLVALVFVAVAPWNPLLWWQLRRLRFSIEVDCDARVLRGGVDVSQYGETLLAIGQHNSRAPIGAIALTETASQLEQRIRIMMTGTYRRSKIVILAATALSISCVAVATQLNVPSSARLLLADANKNEAQGWTLRVKDIDVRDLISLLAHDSGRDVYISSKVGSRAKFSAEYRNTPPSDALDMLLRVQHLVKREEGNTIFIDVASPDAVSTATPHYTGERLNLHFKDIDVRDVLRTIANIGQQNIVVSKSVNMKISVDMQDKPWDEALDIIIRDNGLTRRMEGTILFVDAASTIR